MGKAKYNSFYETINFVRGIVKKDQMIQAFLLIHEVRRAMEKGYAIKSSKDLYARLLMAADQEGIQNPFTDSVQFYNIYSKITGPIPWEYVLELAFQDLRYPILPEVLIRKLASYITAETESVLIAEAEKFVPFVQWIVDQYSTSEFFLVSRDVKYIRALENMFEAYDNVTIVQTNIYEYEFVAQRFDVILASPFFGGRTLVEDTTFICREYDMAALENLSYHLRSGGEMAIVLPGRITFAAGKTADLRNFVQSNYTIKELAELPEGILEYTGARTYLLNIENTRPEDEDVIIRRYSAGERKSKQDAVTELHVEDDTFVMLSELEQQGDWNIDRIFAQQDEDYLNYQNSSVRKDFLGNVARVFRGKSVTKKAENGAIAVVNISNIGEYEIDYENLDTIDEDECKAAHYILQEGDVLLPGRGTAIRTSIFHAQSFPCIAHSNVIVIRPDTKKMSSVYLKLFLDSPLGNKLINSAQQGAAMMNISYKDLAGLEIPVPPIVEQEKAAKEYTKELKIYMDTISAAQKRWKDVLGELQSF